MKVAARFPVKSFSPLLYVIALFHAMLLLLSAVKFGFSWQQIIILPAIVASIYFSNKQYAKITQSPDDLCWSGESWLMHQADKLSSAVYLDLQPDSWVSGQLSLLHFSCDVADISTGTVTGTGTVVGSRANKQEYYWLFSRHELGERMYSQLVYLVKQNIKEQLKINQI